MPRVWPAVCKCFSNDGNRLCMSKVQSRGALKNWPINPVPTKRCQEPSPREFFISLDNIEVSGHEADANIWDFLVWAVKLSSSYHWAPPPKASCKPLISKSTNTLSLWYTLALRLPHQISGHPIVSPLTLERALTSPGTLLKFDSDQLGLGSGVKFISDKSSGDTMLLVHGTHFEERASRQANLCCVFPPLVNIKHLPPNFENLCCFFRAW